MRAEDGGGDADVDAQRGQRTAERTKGHLELVRGKRDAQAVLRTGINMNKPVPHRRRRLL